MDPATLAVICLVRAQDPAAYPSRSIPCAAGAPPIRAKPVSLGQLRAVVTTPQARDALARTVVAEAGDQGDSGIAGVVYTILNRLADGGWGDTVEAVIDAPGQFEPVMRAGGSWRGLKPASATQQARVDTIINLAMDGRLPDLTGGARYFQNPQIVAARARAGTVPAALVNFGGAPPSAVIGAHVFYAGQGPRSGRPAARRGVSADDRRIFVP
jgi:spore germination cell wall hydrolase CwlJ-like protein